MANVAVTPQVSNNGTNFEQQHVQHVYEEIAASMNDIQHKAWPNVKRFLKKFPPGSLIADIGCGNGRYLNINKSIYKVGVDVCSGLVDYARTKGYEVGHADNLNLPFRDGTFDGVVSIGVIHHFCSVERRIKALRELARILRPGGRLMLYVWAFEQKHRKFDSQDVLIPWRGSNKTRPTRTGSSSSLGMSSTSSVSEDESLSQSTDSREQETSQNSQNALQRQSSLSADDVTALIELNEFKPNYYSLDFSVSPCHKKEEYNGSEQVFVWNKDKLRKGLRQTKTDKVISECQKLEASLRAMSSDDLDLMDARNKEKDMLRKKNKPCDEHTVEKMNGLDNDLDETGEDAVNGFLDGKELGVTLDWKVGDLETDDFEAELPCTIYDTDFNENGLKSEKQVNEKHNFSHTEHNAKHSQPAVDSRRPNHFERRHLRKINPFMKQNSLDPYTFNNVKNKNGDIDDMEDRIEDVSDTKEELEDVSVDFKPCLQSKGQSKGAKKQERSFFNAVKSKLLNLFDDNDESKNKEKEKAVPEKLTVVTNHTKEHLSHLSKEQLDLASRLNFKVREFPLSSCPDGINDEKISPRGNLLSDSGIDLDNDNTATVPAARNQHRENCRNGPNVWRTRKTTSLEGKIAADSCVEYSHDRRHSESVLLNGVYDGYIKIDLEKFCENGDIGLNDFHGSALNKYIGNSNLDHIVERIDHDFDNDVMHMPKEPVAEIQKSSTQRCNINMKNSQSIEASSHNGVLHENYTEWIENGLSNGVSPVSQSISRNREKISKRCVEKNESTDVNVKEDDSVFDADNEGMSSKLCRYYHVFRKGEMESLISKHIPDLHIVQCFYDHANWCIIAEKL